ncbi:unnamed protein product [Lactuca saligna]|uniref:Bifunctional inhibitor/plant lipid transfer protein/seed storage helical domain-containing protein n=1 Tax=Lactuca saligna TaxID=75948 RepID=A0AA35ZYR2_LACSI|nr:unnamed protein product [Lactuca saligna]
MVIKSNTIIMAVAMLVGLIFAGLPCFKAQSPVGAPMMLPGAPMAMAPGPDCMTALFNVSDCLSFVQIGSNLTNPDKACCPEVAGLLESNPICLCQLVGGSTAKDYGVDINRALLLPNACKLEVPSINACPSASPVAAPTPSSASEAPRSTTASPGPAGEEGLSPTASGNGGSNGASSSAIHDLSTLICLAAAIFIAYYF